MRSILECLEDFAPACNAALARGHRDFAFWLDANDLVEVVQATKDRAHFQLTATSQDRICAALSLCPWIYTTTDGKAGPCISAIIDRTHERLGKSQRETIALAAAGSQAFLCRLPPLSIVPLGKVGNPTKTRKSHPVQVR